MSSSSDVLVPASDGGRVRVLHHPDLAAGTWTRLGPRTVHGDETTEVFLDGLASEARNAGRSQGYAVGWATGIRDGRATAATAAAEVAEQREAETRAAEARREAEHRQALAVLVQAADELRSAAAGICDRIAEQASDLAFGVTEELLGRELAVATDPGADLVRRVLAALPASGAVTLRLPADLVTDPAVRAATDELADRGITLVASTDLGAGEAVVETDQQLVDLRMTSALARLREVLQ